MLDTLLIKHNYLESNLLKMSALTYKVNIITYIIPKTIS